MNISFTPSFPSKNSSVLWHILPVRIHVIGVVWRVAYTGFKPVGRGRGIPLWIVHIVFSTDQNSDFKLVKTVMGFSFNGDPDKAYSGFLRAYAGVMIQIEGALKNSVYSISAY